MSILHRATTEDELLTAVGDALTLYGWLWTHQRRSDRALTMGHRGFPDIIAARSGVVLAIELKSESGRTSPEQDRWLSALGGPVRTAIVRPSDLDSLLRVLR
jgi:hypothetical protein